MFIQPTTNQKGFSAIEAVIILVVVAALGVGGYFVLSKQQKRSMSEAKVSSALGSEVTWQFEGSVWKPSSTPPACPDPLLQSPVDTTLATSVLYPGQFRGNDYKTHGGFRFDNSKNDDITVKAPMDGRLLRASRYIEQGEVQYLFMFENPCGILYRFDHLLTLTPKFQAVVDKLRPAEVDNSMTTEISDVAVKSGEVIAIAVGFKNGPNVSVDFGINDLRKPNEISKNATWAAKHSRKDFDAYGVCWIDLLPQADKARMQTLPPGDAGSGAISDYCKTTAGTTVD